MDPNATLAELRRALRALEDAAEGDSNDAEIEAAHEVADACEALIDWLDHKGFLPSDWECAQ